MAGARISTDDEAWHSDVVLHVAKPSTAEITQLRDGAVLVSLLAPALDPGLVEALATRPITG